MISGAGMSSSKEGGFVQAAVLVGIAILAIVMAAFALGNQDSSQNISAEKHRMNAMVVLKQAHTLSDALKRAIADGYPQTDPLMSFLVTGGFIVALPNAPSEATGLAIYIKPAGSPSPIGNLGTPSGADTYILLWSVYDEVCKRINGVLYDSAAIPAVADAHVNMADGKVDLISATWLNRAEGCLPLDPPAANTNVYYKVVDAQ